MEGRILIVDDDLSMCRMLASGLESVGYRASYCKSAAEALSEVQAGELDLVITDVRMRQTDGLELCRQLVSLRPDLPVIVITAFGSMETAIDAIRAGAYDFITKPFELDAIRLAAGRAVQHRQLKDRVRRLEQVLQETSNFCGLIGASAPMQRVCNLIGRVPATDTTVLLTGESGTGKELAARALHSQSPRRGQPFIAVSCAAVPEALLESELFGHLKGAFTDARTGRAGLFQQAHGGTLFLDEIGELPLGLQPKLLRAVQERAARQVGGDAELPFDARLVAATNCNLEEEVEAGRFREDLYYRLHVIKIELPPLRQRGNDVLLLAQHFLAQFAGKLGKQVDGINTAAAQRLLSYPWPGNVRELRNAIEHAVTLCQRSEIAVEDFPEKIQRWQSSSAELSPVDPAELLPMEEVERRYVLRVFELTGGNKAQTARILGFNRKTLYRKLERYGLLGGMAGAEEP